LKNHLMCGLSWSVFVLFSMSQGRSFAFEGLAVLGDSSSTAAGSHPRLEFDSKNLWQVFNGTLDLSVSKSMVPEAFRDSLEDSPLPPQRLGPSRRENDGGSGWIWHQVSQSIASRTIEAHTLSYGYLLGRKLGISPPNILIGGENGTTSRHAWIHAARLVDVREGELPAKVMFFYTGNDLCAVNTARMTDAETYGDYLLKGMKYLALNGHVSARGTKIFIPGFLTVTSLLHEPSIMQKKIRLHGEEVTCQEARDRFFERKTKAGATQQDITDPRYLYFSQVMPPSPVQFCHTLFGRGATDSAHLSFLANRIRAYREAQKTVVDAFNVWRGKTLPSKAIDAVYVAATESLTFEARDVGPDCFHLSAEGQAKVAQALVPALR
jgi:lysophospholipase L1-like esterase